MRTELSSGANRRGGSTPKENIELNLSVSAPSKGFAAIAHSSARVLILGSLPGAESLKRQQYYAKPMNVFWRIMGELFGATPELPYAQRTQILTDSGIAVWDVCASAHRIGSLDSAIKNHAVNDFAGFFDQHPKIKLVCFNGQKASEIYRRSVLDKLAPRLGQLPTRILPSTSPANAGIPYADRLQQWSSILPDCGPNPLVAASTALGK